MSATKKRRQPQDRYNLADQRADAYCRVSKDSTGQEKSVNDQEALFRAFAEREGVIVGLVLRDVSLSASVFAKKGRPAYDALCQRIEAGQTDLVWIWALNRATRRGRTFYEFIELCQEAGVRLVIDGRVYDPNDEGDLLQLGITNVMDANYSLRLSKDTRRGRLSAALAGRPGSVAFGYRRHYDDKTGRSDYDEPDTWRDDGSPIEPIEDSPAYVVREVFDRVLHGETIHRIVADLDRRGIRTRRGNPISRSALHKILRTQTYIGRRLHNGEVIERPDGVKPFTPALVDPDVFWAVQNILDGETRVNAAGHVVRRKTWRAAKSDLLLSTVIRCAECGGKMRGRVDHRAGRHDLGYYSCEAKGCASIEAARLDPVIEEIVTTWLADPVVVECLTTVDDSEVTKAARADADEARVKLAEWQRAAESGEVDAKGYAMATKGLLARIAAADELSSTTSLPPVIRDKIGEHARQTWTALPLDVKRQVIRTIADFRVKRVPPGAWRGGVPAAARITCRWLIGPDQSDLVELDDIERYHRLAVTPPAPKRTHCPAGHEFTPENTQTSKQGWRQCRACHNERQRARRAARRARSLLADE